MTGYGKAEGQIAGKKITVEIRSVNSKGLDLNTRISSYFREKEMEIRKLVGEHVLRGKCEISIYAESLGGDKNSSINFDLAEAYLNELKPWTEKHQIPQNELLSSVLKMPEVINAQKEELVEEDWFQLKELIALSLKNFSDFRLKEGESLESDFQLRVSQIEKLMMEVNPLEEERIIAVKEKLNENLKNLESTVEINENRLEQELIFYLEKLDVSEEKVRLNSHCNYFKEELKRDVDSKGKKLGFISQEMGREINTLGSKANHAGIQRLVVQMKDELEKIKEQVLNTL